MNPLGDELKFETEQAAWEETMAGLFDWAADHPRESFRPGPPAPVMCQAPITRMGPGMTQATPPVQPPATDQVNPSKIGRYAVPTIVKKPE
jgi:hypothetical protein